MTDNYTEAVNRLLDAVDRALPFFVARGETSYARRGELRAAADHVRATARGIETTLAGSMRERRQAIGPDVAEPITVPDVEPRFADETGRDTCTCGKPAGQHVTGCPARGRVPDVEQRSCECSDPPYPPSPTHAKGCPARERVPLVAQRDWADRCRCPKSMTDRNRHRPGCAMYAGEGP